MLPRHRHACAYSTHAVKINQPKRVETLSQERNITLDIFTTRTCVEENAICESVSTILKLVVAKFLFHFNNL